MANINPVPGQAAAVKDDPAKPWKALAPAVLGVAYSVVEGIQVANGDNVWDTNDTLTVILLGLAAIASYVVPNPKVARRS